MFASIVRFIRDWKRYNNSVSELSRLGDRELADIGISRSDIQRVAWNASHPQLSARRQPISKAPALSPRAFSFAGPGCRACRPSA